MSRGNKWVPLDKYLTQEFKSIRRKFSMIEAMFSYSVDHDNGVNGTISGYSKLWGWSRNKVRNFINCIRTDEGHLKDRKRTHEGHPIHFIDNALMNKKDSQRTDEGHPKDSHKDTTKEPDPKPDPKPKKTYSNEIYNFTDDFIKKIAIRNPKQKIPDREKSADAIDKLIRLEKHSLDYIKKVLLWAVDDSFWGPNVKSLIPLRKKANNGFLKFDNIVTGFEKGKINGQSNQNFDEVIYEGTKPEDIKW